MNIRFKKEFQSLFWPWLVAASIGLVPLLSWMLPAAQLEQSFHRIYALAGAGFVLGIALLSTMPFGEEFSLRTMPMLLTSPVSRRQVWREKLVITLCLTLSVALLNSAGYTPFWALIQNQMKLAVAFLVFTICSGAFFTLLARSTIGGAALCLFAQAAVLLTTYGFTQTNYYKVGYWNPHARTEEYLLVSSLIVSPIFLLLGWKLFARLQYTDATDVDIPLLPQTLVKRKSPFSILNVHPGFPLLNQLTKELSFYNPVFVMAYLFACLWITATVLLTIYPHKSSLLSNTLDGFTIIYVPLVLLICGCVSLGEEKKLGLHQQNLTLPIAWKTQWAVKLSIAIVLGVVFAMLLPTMLVMFGSVLSFKQLDTGLKHLLAQPNLPWVFSLICAAVVSVSFWAATMTNRTIHATFLSGFTIVVIAVFHTMGRNVSFAVGQFTGYPVDWITAHLHLDLDWGIAHTAEVFYLSYLMVGLLFPLVSRAFYPKQQISKASIPTIALAVIAASWLAGFISSDITTNLQRLHWGSRFVKETEAALVAVRANHWQTNYQNDRWFSTRLLSDTQELSPLTKEWLDKGVFIVHQSSFPDYINKNEMHYRISVEVAGKGGLLYSYYFVADTNSPISRIQPPIQKRR